MINEITKLCKSCNQTKAETEFNFRKNTKNFILNSYCKHCSSTKPFINTPEKFIYYIFSIAKKRAKTYNREFTIKIEDLLEIYNIQKGICNLSKIAMTHVPGHKRNNINYNISIDRIDSNKDYTKDNIQLVCATINQLKTNLKQNHFVQLCKLVAGVKL